MKGTPISTTWKSLEFTTSSDGSKGGCVAIPDLGKKIAECGTNGAFTVECFVKNAIQRIWKSVYTFGYNSSTESSRRAKLCSTASSNKVGFQCDSSEPSGYEWITDRWYHMALVYTKGTVKLYVDSVLHSSKSLTITGIDSGVKEFTLGGRTTTVECFSGKIAGVRVSDTALDPSQFLRAARYDAAENARQGDIYGLWSFSEGTAGELVKTASNAVDSADWLTGRAAGSNGTAPRYSDDVPAPNIWLSSTNHTVIASNIKSARFFATVGGTVGKAGTPNAGAGVLELRDIRTPMKAKGPSRSSTSSSRNRR